MPSGTTWTSKLAMSSASSPLDQPTRRWPSPGETERLRGGSGGASAYLMFTERKVTVGVPPKRLGSWSWTQRTLTSGFAEVRVVTSGASQGAGTPASPAGSTICEAVTVNDCVCAAGVGLRKG